MKIRLKEGQTIAGPDVAPVDAAASLFEVPDAVAAALVKAGHAETVDPEPKKAK